MATEYHPIVVHIDDDADDRLLVAEAIQHVDPALSIKQASNGKEGLDQLLQMKNENKLPCLVIVDLNMPGINGQNVIEEMHKDEVLKSVPVIVLTTSCHSSSEEFFMKNNIECVTKPTSVKDLKTMIKNMLEQCKIHQ